MKVEILTMEMYDPAFPTCDEEDSDEEGGFCLKVSKLVSSSQESSKSQSPHPITIMPATKNPDSRCLGSSCLPNGIFPLPSMTRCVDTAALKDTPSYLWEIPLPEEVSGNHLSSSLKESPNGNEQNILAEVTTIEENSCFESIPLHAPTPLNIVVKQEYNNIHPDEKMRLLHTNNITVPISCENNKVDIEVQPKATHNESKTFENTFTELGTTPEESLKLSKMNEITSRLSVTKIETNLKEDALHINTFIKTNEPGRENGDLSPKNTTMPLSDFSFKKRICHTANLQYNQKSEQEMSLNLLVLSSCNSKELEHDSLKQTMQIDCLKKEVISDLQIESVTIHSEMEPKVEALPSLPVEKNETAQVSVSKTKFVNEEGATNIFMESQIADLKNDNKIDLWLQESPVNHVSMEVDLEDKNYENVKILLNDLVYGVIDNELSIKSNEKSPISLRRNGLENNETSISSFNSFNKTIGITPNINDSSMDIDKDCKKLPEVEDNQICNNISASEAKFKSQLNKCSGSEESSSPASEDIPVRRRSSRIRSLEQKKDKPTEVKVARKKQTGARQRKQQAEEAALKRAVLEDLKGMNSSDSSGGFKESSETSSQDKVTTEPGGKSERKKCAINEETVDSFQAPPEPNTLVSLNSKSMDGSRKLDDSKKPEKVKSRWRRNSELERVFISPDPSILSNNIPIPVITESSVTTSVPDTLAEGNETKSISAAPAVKIPPYEKIHQNIYLFERRKCKSKKEVRRMVCDCTLTKEEKEEGVIGCLEDCLNRLLMIECGSRCALGNLCANKRFEKQLHANVSAFKTERKGFGIKANEPLESGTFLIEYVGEVLNAQDFKQRVKQYARERNDHYYFMALKSDEIIDATCKGNVSRFINHSCEPNCEMQKWTVNGELRVGFFTIKAVKADEELTFDYQFQRYGREAQRCFCESTKCRGFIGSEKQITLKSTTKSPIPKRKRNYEERKKEDLEDLALEEELEKLSRFGGLKNQEQTLMMARLMVRAESLESRKRLLDIILNTQEQSCLRLFLDYHGLTLLWSWMVDLGDDAIALKTQILKILAFLPIQNKTILLDSKVLSVVQRWALQQSVTAENKPLPSAEVGCERRGSDTPEQTSSGPSSGATTPRQDLLVDTLDGSQNDISAGVSSSKRPRLLSKEESESATCNPGLNCHQDQKMDCEDLNLLDIVVAEVVKHLINSVCTVLEVKPKAIEKKEEEELAELDPEEERSQIAEAASDLINTWSNLKEIFRIPRLEHQKRKEDERAASVCPLDKEASVSPCRRDSQYRRNERSPRREKMRDDLNENRKLGDSPDISKSIIKRVLLPTPSPRLSKEEHRQLFALKVQQMDEEEALRKQKEYEEMALQVSANAILPQQVDFSMMPPGYCPPIGELPPGLDFSLSEYHHSQINYHLEHYGQYPEYPVPNDYIGHSNGCISVPPSTDYIGQPPPYYHPGYQQGYIPQNQNLVSAAGPIEHLVHDSPNPRSSNMQPTFVDSNAVFSNLPVVYHQQAPISFVATKPVETVTATLTSDPSPAIQSENPCSSPFSSSSPIPVSEIPLPSFDLPVSLIPLPETPSSNPASQPSPQNSPSPLEDRSPSASPMPAGLANIPLIIQSQIDSPSLTNLLSPSPTLPTLAVTSLSTSGGPTVPTTVMAVIPNQATTMPPSYLTGQPPYMASQGASIYYVQSSGAVVPLPDQPLGSMAGVPLVHVSLPAPITGLEEPIPPQAQKPVKLPPHWKTAKDSEGNIYYYHSITRETQWDPPLCNEEDTMDVGTPTFDEPKHSKKKTTTAPADTSSEVAKRTKESFRTKMSSYIVQCLNPFRKPDCKLGKISTTEDFKHLARKLTHFVMAKELKHCQNVEDLECNENVKHKAKDFVQKYMAKFGSHYKKEKSSPRDY